VYLSSKSLCLLPCLPSQCRPHREAAPSSCSFRHSIYCHISLTLRYPSHLAFMVTAFPSQVRSRTVERLTRRYSATSSTVISLSAMFSVPPISSALLLATSCKCISAELLFLLSFPLYDTARHGSRQVKLPLGQKRDTLEQSEG